MKNITCTLIVGIFVMLSTAYAGQPIEALKGPIQQVVKILEDPQYDDPAKREELRAKIREATKDMFDFDLIAKRATGRYHWENSFTPQQRQEFTNLFAEFLGNNYLLRVSGNLKDIKVEYLSEEIEDSRRRAKVRTRIPQSKGDIAVDYSMWLRDGSWKIYDVFVEGVSLVQNYQTQFRSLFEKETAAQVIDRLKQKIEEQKREVQATG